MLQPNSHKSVLAGSNPSGSPGQDIIEPPKTTLYSPGSSGRVSPISLCSGFPGRVRRGTEEVSRIMGWGLSPQNQGSWVELG